MTQATAPQPSASIYLEVAERKLKLQSRQLYNGVWEHSILGPRRSGKTQKLADHLAMIAHFLGDNELALVLTAKLVMTKIVVQRAESILNANIGQTKWRSLKGKVLSGSFNVLSGSFNTLEHVGRGCIVPYIFIDEFYMMTRKDYDCLVTFPNLREIYQAG